MAEIKKINEPDVETGAEAAAETVLKTKNNENHITLSEEIIYNGEHYSELDFDFTKLRAKDAMSIEQELQAQKIVVLVESASTPYLLRLAVRACKQKIGVDIFDKMSFVDFKNIKRLARNFMLNLE